jgi:DHA1 family bicyclomycin/chloramphenicol resistance-like MFS transporter
MTQSERQTLGLILLLAFLAAIGPLSVDTYLPGLPSIAADLGVPSALAQQSVTTFFVGIALGQLLAGPLSDRFGRRPVLLVGFGLYFLATIACALAQDAHTLIVARGLQGLAAAASPAAGRAMVRDLWHSDRAARAMSYITMAVIIAPLIAPTLGGAILVHWGWRAIFWMLLIFAATALTLVLWRLPETNGPEKRGNVYLVDYFRAYARVVRHPQAWAYLFCGGLPYAAIFAYITASPFVYIELFGVSPVHFGYYFGLNVAGLFIGTWINSLLVERYGYHRMLAGGVTISFAGSLFLLGMSLAGLANLPMVVIGLFIAVAPVSMVGANSTVGLLNLFPANAGAAAALFGVAQFGFGAIASLLVGLLYTGTPTAMTLTMAIACGGAFLSLLWLNRYRRAHPRADILP